MIKMVAAKDLTLGMKLSTDGLVVQNLHYMLGNIVISGMCHGVWKRALFDPDHELPIYYDDTNGGED